MTVLADGLILEHRTGVNDGLNFALACIDKAKNHPQIKPEAHLGLDMATMSIELLKEEFARHAQNESNTVTETNGEKSDG